VKLPDLTTIQLDAILEAMAKTNWVGELGRIEEALLRRKLERVEGNRTRAAAELGLNRTTLVEKLRKYGLQNFMRIEGEDLARQVEVIEI
jgi:DNA-binding NtrC family response regulator